MAIEGILHSKCPDLNDTPTPTTQTDTIWEKEFWVIRGKINSVCNLKNINVSGERTNKAENLE